MKQNKNMGRPLKFNLLEIEKIKASISSMVRAGEHITWKNICEKVNAEICPKAPTTAKTLAEFNEIAQAYKKAKDAQKANANFSKTYKNYDKPKLMSVIKKLEIELEQARAELLEEKERKIVAFETFLSRPQKRNPKFFDDLRDELENLPF